jgi:hypothetical protein
MQKWIGACLVGLGATGLFAGTSPAKADDAVLNVRPAVLQTTVNQPTSVTVQPVRWRGGYYGGWGGPAVRVYAGPRYYNRGFYGGNYRPYGYGYGYPAYGYGYSYPAYGYGYAPYGSYYYGW